ncbi:hypothetical protein Q9S36_48070 [Microbacterium sp. ARD31]|uniref:hypothetical protein n=1 Tax=Microbacterium sp. ARD31 TaxID=2962576 RepID=UPI002881AAC1|nr:hypothetical protein [Microbacterium sp. ARD31]MDT0187971.1 hypothetical protein [Microbacterium sp. ARD31]
MMIRTLLASALTVVSLGIGGTATASVPSAAEQAGAEYKSQVSTPQTELRQAVYTYSRAFLGGNARKAYALLAPRCRNAIAYNDFAEVVDAAHDVYGNLPIRSYTATISGDRARVTYRYPVGRLDQVREPWVRRVAGWRNNQC